MKIIQPSATAWVHGKPLTPEIGIDLLRWIEYNARISHRSEEKQTDDSWQRFLSAVVLQHGDWSVAEHATATVIFRVDRGVTHELVRHRLFSFTQESTRFVNYSRQEIEFIEPVWPDREHATTPEPCRYPWQEHMRDSETAYLSLLEWKANPQMARSVLPNATAATISTTGNLRNWRHFFLMRSSRETHPDFRRVTIPLLAEFKRCIPLLYDDIEPNNRQIDNLSKAK
jgi:thymidylate synthase (FAD)